MEGYQKKPPNPPRLLQYPQASPVGGFANGGTGAVEDIKRTACLGTPIGAAWGILISKTTWRYRRIEDWLRFREYWSSLVR